MSRLRAAAAGTALGLAVAAGAIAVASPATAWTQPKVNECPSAAVLASTQYIRQIVIGYGYGGSSFIVPDTLVRQTGPIYPPSSGSMAINCTYSGWAYNQSFSDPQPYPSGGRAEGTVQLPWKY